METNGGHIAVNGFFDQPAIFQRVAQVVVRVRMLRFQSQRRAIALDRLIDLTAFSQRIAYTDPLSAHTLAPHTKLLPRLLYASG